MPLVPDNYRWVVVVVVAAVIFTPYLVAMLQRRQRPHGDPHPDDEPPGGAG